MTERFKILAIDDEKKILQLIEDVLSDSYQIVLAQNGEQGIALAQEQQPDLILVDKIMPKMDGIETTRFIRKCLSTKHIPIIMLTALKQPEDRTIAFHAGVDDFVSKPFHPDELIARIAAKIGRFRDLQEKKTLKNELICLNLRLDLAGKSISINDQTLRLTPIEFEILRCLLSNQGKVQTRTDLINEVRGEADADPRALDAHVTSLRKKIRRFSGKIETVYGQGYIIRE